MKQYIPKSDIVTEIKRQLAFSLKEIENNKKDSWSMNIAKKDILQEILSFLDTLEVIDPYEQCVQYDSIKAGIQANAETYSFNIESNLFNQLTKEQQGLWRKEIEQAYISGGDTGVVLARDIRYEENVDEVKEIDLDKEVTDWWDTNYSNRNYTFEKYHGHYLENSTVIDIAKHFFELGLRYKSSYISVPNIDDTLKEMGVDPDSKIAKTFKELYCMALEKFKEKKEI